MLGFNKSPDTAPATRSVPPIDLQVPDGLRTATFGVG